MRQFLLSHDGGFACHNIPVTNGPVIRRFQIEDLIIQDESGIVFRALDTETGKPVAVRRFFPFGESGDGLQDDEQVAYGIAISRLAGIQHPALRAAICGGCDPVDGMPFIATEWVEGEALPLILQGQNMPVESTTELITKALEVCELLSQIFAEEAVWVETDLQTIVVGNEESGRGFTFWISPFKWLGRQDSNRGLESIVALTEEVMGWTGQIVNDQAGRGLGGWVNWLRNAASTTSLHEAREMLAASVGIEPPPPAGHLVAKATAPALKPLKRPGTSKMPMFAILSLCIAIAGLGSWQWIRKPSRTEPPALAEAAPTVPETPAPAPKPRLKSTKPVVMTPVPQATPPPTAQPAPPPARVSDETERTNRRIAELSAQLAGAEQQAEQQATETLADQQAAVDRQGGVFSPAHCELLLENDGEEVTVQGHFETIAFSGTGKTLYLLFPGDDEWKSARGSVGVSKAPADLSEQALRPLVGKTIRLRGKVEVQKSYKRARPLIVLTDRAAIEVVE